MAKNKAAETANRMAVGRHSGEHIWGYEVLPDGSIVLSPGFADRFRTILDRENGLMNMQKAVNIYVADQLALTSKERRQWWDDLQKDLGIVEDDGPNWTFDQFRGAVRKVEKPKAEKA